MIPSELPAEETEGYVVILPVEVHPVGEFWRTPQEVSVEMVLPDLEYSSGVVLRGRYTDNQEQMYVRVRADLMLVVIA